MIAPDDARRLILENVFPLAAEWAPLMEGVGRVLAQDLTARADLPPFDNSAMDGYAVNVSRAPRADTFRVREVVRAGGRPGGPLDGGEAVKIMTGAPVPEGAEAVVMKELAATDAEGRVRFHRRPEPGENIRRRGEDVRAGELLLAAGVRLRPYEIGLLAAQGFSDVPVVRRPRAAVLSTGDELVRVDEEPGPGQIRDANACALAAALGRWGAVTRTLGLVKDDAALLRAAFEAALETADLLLVGGGVSVGDFDHTKAVLEEMGMRVVFWKVAIKPGKPLLFGTLRGKPVFGLPGNPVAALVCTEEFVRPAVEKMQGHHPGHPPYHLEGVLENDYAKDETRQQYLFCQVSPSGSGFRVRVIRPQGSARLGMAARANALALGPLGVRRLEKGSTVRFRWLK